MTPSFCPISHQVIQYCARIGKDPLLVQGGGGNASWKDREELWVKASGTWLAHSEQANIFVPVDLAQLQHGFSRGDYSVRPEVLHGSDMRPSIETLLHALMPHRVVLHLHAVEILAYLVRKDPFAALHRLIDNRIDAVFLAYFTPGASLAGAVAEELKAHPSAEVVFLKSHGVVIGGEDVDSVDRTLRTLLSLLEVEQGTSSSDSEEIRNEEVAMRNCFVRCKDERLNELATNSQFWGRLRDDWALYPDHVVFLGDRALMIESFDYLERLAELPERPPFAFLKGQGVFEGEVTTDAHRAQLRCYYEVLLRQPPHQKLSSLTDSQTAELLNWDAEKYRQRIVPIK